MSSEKLGKPERCNPHAVHERLQQKMLAALAGKDVAPTVSEFMHWRDELRRAGLGLSKLVEPNEMLIGDLTSKTKT